MNIRGIKSGEYKVVATGSVITFDDNPIEVTFDIGDSNSTIRFVFMQDSSKKEIEIKSRFDEDGEKLNIEMINLPDSLGGTSTPFGIGNLDGKKIYLGLRSSKIGNSRDLHFTIYHE